MNITYANFSTDLRRVSYWIYQGNFELSKKFLVSFKNKYKIDGKIACFKNIWDEIDKLKKLKGGRLKASEGATTISSILLQEALKG